jgi:hypothetical protein
MVAVALCGAASCSSGAHPKGPRRLDAKEIVQRSKPAIVRIEDADGRVGTGFAIDASGLIATNLHVVFGARDIRVTTLDGTVLPVTSVVALDPEHDLALIDVDPAAPMPTLALGDSDLVEAGDPVVAIGNPLGVLDYTVSDGLISSVRQMSPEVTVLQISAPISQGSSGGPLFNPFGEVIGVATALSTEGQNLNFAVPSNYLRALRKNPRPMSVAEFAELTRPRPREIEANGIKITRAVPDHPVSLFTGCGEADVVGAVEAITEAIALGAPLYNSGNHEACFRIYEGTSTKLERDSRCRGIRDAFGAGLLRVATMPTFTEKAWGLRDTFDGLLDVATRYARARAAAPAGAGGAPPRPDRAP